MNHNEILAPCTQCKTVDLLRPYGCQDAMICFDCAVKQAERVTALVTEAAEQMKRLS